MDVQRRFDIKFSGYSPQRALESILDCFQKLDFKVHSHTKLEDLFNDIFCYIMDTFNRNISTKRSALSYTNFDSSFGLTDFGLIECKISVSGFAPQVALNTFLNELYTKNIDATINTTLEKLIQSIFKVFEYDFYVLNKGNCNYVSSATIDIGFISRGKFIGNVADSQNPFTIHGALLSEDL